MRDQRKPIGAMPWIVMVKLADSRVKKLHCNPQQLRQSLSCPVPNRLRDQRMHFDTRRSSLWCGHHVDQTN